MRVLVVGLGSMGRRRLRCLRALGVEAVAGLDPTEERATEVAEEFDIETFATLEDALSWRPDALVVSTPPDLHRTYAHAAAEHGLHFFTEASVVPEDTSALEELVRDAGIVGVPSCTMRFHSAIDVIRRRLADDAIGRVLAVTHHVGQYLPDWHPWEDYRSFYVARRETGAAREITAFELNWMTHLFGRVTEVAGFQGKLSELDVDIDDAYLSLLGFASGVRATLVIEAISRPAIREARLVGETGTLIWDWSARCVREWTAEAGTWTVHPDPEPIPGPGGDWVSENMYIAEMRGFLAAIDGDRDAYPFSLAEDRHLLHAVSAAERSWKDRRWEVI